MRKGSLLKQPYIPRIQADPGEASFEGLLDHGIDLTQQLSGSIWTDYNEHDPGVTILEQVCYALTDVMYRADFPVEDFLVGENGRIDWKKQSLLPPETAFPCRPTTIPDYNAALRDELVPGILNVRLEPKPGHRRDGLYRIVLVPFHEDIRVSGERSQEIFSGWRNLCEDLDDIETLDTVDYALDARVDIREGFDPAEILAKIYYQCGKKVTAGIEFEPFDMALGRHKNPEEVFRGPFTDSGVVATDSGAPLAVLPDLEVFRLIRNVEGVESVTVNRGAPVARGPASAAAKPADAKPYALRVRLPKPDDKIQIQVFRGGRQIKPNEHDIEMNYRKQHFANRIVPSSPEQVAALLLRPTGFYRDISEYSSVQYQFPGIYGLGDRGVPKSAGRERMALANQLKAYLLFFDQHLADYLAMLDNLRSLFSTDLAESGKTYFFQVLEEDAFPGIDDVYPRFPSGTLKRLPGFDDNIDRTKRILDYFLALYGESFRDDISRSSKPETRVAEDISARDDRLAYLREIEEVTRDRAGAVDYTKEFSERGRSGLEAKLSRILGFQKNYANGERVRLMEHILLRPRAVATNEYKDVPADFFAFRITVMFPSWPASGRDENFRRYAEETVRANCPAHIFAEIRWFSRDEMDNFDRLHETWWCAQLDWRNSQKTEPDAAALDLIGFLRGMTLGKLKTEVSKLPGLGSNTATGETYWLIEHCELRPASNSPTSAGVHKDVPESFYSFRISILFPEGVSRAVAIAAEKTVQEHCPAHISADIHWLTPDEMLRFGRLHGDWRHKREAAPEAAALRLIGFLREKRRKRSR